jgi:hypothetical protein
MIAKYTPRCNGSNVTAVDKYGKLAEDPGISVINDEFYDLFGKKYMEWELTCRARPMAKY